MNFDKGSAIDLDFPDDIAGNDDEAGLEAKPDVCFPHVVFSLPLIIAYLFEVRINFVGVFDFDQIIRNSGQRRVRRQNSRTVHFRTCISVVQSLNGDDQEYDGNVEIHYPINLKIQ